MNSYLYVMFTSKNSRSYADLALDSFFKNTKLNSTDEFLLIDNDNEGNYPTKSVIKNSAPQSFSKNCNMAIDIADGRNLMILSNDVIFTKDWNEPLKQFKNLICIPSCNQTHTYSFNDLILKLNMNLNEFNNKNFQLENICKIHKRQNPPKLFERLLMAFYTFMLPANVYKKIGYFDERFGIGGGEDVDYRLRAIELDIPVKYNSQSYVLHFGGKTTWDGPENLEDIKNRDQKYFNEFVNKWNYDLANLCLVNNDPMITIQKYHLESMLSTQDFSKIIKAVLNNSNRT